MASIFLPTSISSNVIKVDGICYQLVGGSNTVPDHTAEDVEDTFEDCESCESPVPQACPEDECVGCNLEYTATVSGFTGDCSILNGTYACGNGGPCSWEGFNDVFVQAMLGCEDGVWSVVLLDLMGSGCTATFTSDNTTGCPTLGSYSGGTGSLVMSTY